MRFTHGLSALLACCAASVFMMSCPAGIPSIPMTPFADMVKDSLAFFTSATDPKGGDIMFVFDFGDGSTGNSRYVSSGDSGYACHSFDGTGTYAIRAKAVNRDGRESDWSEAVEFTRTQPPVLADTILGPWWYGVDRCAKYRVVVTDPEGDSVAAKFIWGNNTESEWSDLVASGDTIVDSVNFWTAGLWDLRVLLKDKGNVVARSDVSKQVKVTQVAVLWWNEEMETEYEASPTLRIRGDELLIYAASDMDSLECWSSDGSLVWQVGFENTGGYYFAPSLSPDGSRLYIVEMWEDALRCVDADNGTLVWTLSDSMSLSGTPAIGPNGEVYIVDANRAELVKVIDEGSSPRIEWRQDVGNWISDGVAIDEDGVIYLLGSGYPYDYSDLLAVSPDGSILWQDSTHIPHYECLYAPVIDGSGRILAGDDNDGGLYCFNKDGSFVWSNPDVYAYPGGITVGPDSRIYGVGYEEKVYCLDSDGELVWETVPGDEGVMDNAPCISSNNSLIAYDTELDIIYCMDFDGELLWQLWAMDSIEGLRRSRSPRDEGDEYSSPIIGPDGNLYLTSLWGMGVYCVSLGDATLADAPWPCYAHDAARSSWAGRQE